MSFYWYDFETFGADPMRDRPAQFAGQRTDEDFNPIGEPLVIYCKPANDFLPQPEACRVTGITPQLAAGKGLPEAEFIRRIQQEFARPGTCVVGYNNLRFDDEVTRHCLYRNFYDPYAREWQNRNSRWDLIDLVRLARAVRPEGINWPDHEDGTPSFKLEHLTAANAIEQVGAHDALVDVQATIELARLVRSKQPKLYDYVLQHRDKRNAEQLLSLGQWKPLLHVSAMYPAQKGCAALVVALARDAVNKNAIYVYDLSVDPGALEQLPVEEVHRLIFTPKEQLAEGEQRIPIKAVHINKCPVLVPANVVTPEIAERLQLNLNDCRENLRGLREMGNLPGKIRQVFSRSNFAVSDDPDQMLYAGGFFSDADRQLMNQLVRATPQELASQDWPFQDERLPEMLFRYRARNYPESLNSDERDRWEAYRLRRIMAEDGGASIHLAEFDRQLAELDAGSNSDECAELVAKLREYRDALIATNAGN